MRLIFIALILYLATGEVPVSALQRPEKEFKIFQFPADMIPRIDGDASDWDIAPDDYAIDIYEHRDDYNNRQIDTSDMDLTVKVGWVKGMSKLYFCVKSYDDFWNFINPTLLNDLFEVVVDADLSGGHIIKHGHPKGDSVPMDDLHFSMHGVHAQNYHVFMPPGDKDWCFVWGAARWARKLPWSNSACGYDFKHGESGDLVLEFWITPFDYADPDGPATSVVSTLTENSIIGLTWGRTDYDNQWHPDGIDDMTVSCNKRIDKLFDLSHTREWFVRGTDLCAFRLMPLEERFQEPIKAFFDFEIIDMERRVVAFTDMSEGSITQWTWQFPDGTVSHERHPVHIFDTPGGKTVVLTVEGPAGTDSFPIVYEELFLK